METSSSSESQTQKSQRLIIEPTLEISQQPKQYIHPTDSCQFQIVSEILKLESQTDIMEINARCHIKNMNLENNNNLHGLKFFLCVSLVCKSAFLFWESQRKNQAANNQSVINLDEMIPFSLKSFDSKIRIQSQKIIKNVANPSLSQGLQNSFLFQIDQKTMDCKIHSLCIVRKTQLELKEMLENFVLKEMSTSSNSNDIDLDLNLEPLERRTNELLEELNSISDTICLKLQVIIYDTVKNKWETFLTEPVYSNPISLKCPVLRKKLLPTSENKNLSISPLSNTEMMGDSENDNGAETDSTESIVNPNNLRILRSSRIYGRMEGGDEIILLTSFIDPTDIQVEFFQLINDIEIKWRSLAILNKIDIHGNCSLVFRTPPYKLSDVQSQSQSSSVAQDASNTTKTSSGNNSASKSHSRIKVYYRLCRPSTGDHSEKWVFFYCQDYLYDEYRILFGDRIVNDSRLLTRLFATSKLNLKSSNNSFETKIASNKRKIDELANDNEHEHDSNRDNLLPKVKIESNDMMDFEMKQNEIDESTSKKLATKWLKKDVVERSLKDTTGNEANSSGATTSSKASALNTDEICDYEMNAEQLTKIIECVVNTPTSSIYTNEDDETSGGEQACAKSPLAVVTRSKVEKRDCETQIGFEDMLKFAEGENQKLDLGKYMQLKTNLDSCINKMNAVADRTSKALLKFAQNRSLRDFLKTQRFLLNAQDDDGNTPIHLAILYGNFDLLSVFVDVAATISFQNIINIRNKNQFTPLMIAAYLGEVEVCEYLLEAQADMTITDSFGSNIVHIACKKKNLSLLKVILKYVNKNNCYSVLNAINHEGLAPIHLAVFSESLEILSELLYNRKYLKMNILDKRRGYTALHYAATRAKLTPMVNLLAKNDDIEVNARSFIDATPLHIAVANKNYMSTICLIANGADINIQSKVPVHFDWDLFQTTQRMSTCLQTCIERVFEEKKQKPISVKAEAVNLKKEPSEMDIKEANITNTLAKQNEISKTTETTTTTITEQQTGTNVKSGSTFTNKPVFPNLGSTTEFLKLSQEVKKQYQFEMDKIKRADQENLSGNNGSISRPRSKQSVNFHNYDAFYYAQNDPWMLEIFNSRGTLPRSLIEKVICFDRVKDFVSENQIGLNNGIVKDFMQKTQEALDELKSRKQIKISQQATDPIEDDQIISSTTSETLLRQNSTSDQIDFSKELPSSSFSTEKSNQKNPKLNF